MIAAVTNQGKAWFMSYSGRLRLVRLIVFMQRLIEDAPCKGFLNRDNLNVQTDKVVREWSEERVNRIEVF